MPRMAKTSCSASTTPKTFRIAGSASCNDESTRRMPDVRESNRRERSTRSARIGLRNSSCGMTSEATTLARVTGRARVGLRARARVKAEEAKAKARARGQV